MDKEQELTGPSVCKHCGNETVFKKEGIYTHRYTDDDTEVWAEYQWQLHRCLTCSKPTLWQLRIDSDEVSYDPDGEIHYYIWKELYPIISEAPDPSLDMPKDIIEDYKEASAVLPYSPRASAALLRLVLQKLCIHLGQPGKNLNDDIRALVKAGLSPKVQQALDAVRVIGNNAVHPGEINLNDKPEIALTLFKLINLIVEEMITRPREIKEIYESLPQGQRDQIKKRDEIA